MVKRLLAILFWSVISAAFIGPGTVTTAATAGAAHGLTLLWALAFSTVACLVLQEAAARVTVVSGRDLASALANRYGGAGGAMVKLLVLGAIVVGCAAYEAGNILGGVAGMRLAVELPGQALTALSAAVAGGLLWWRRPGAVARSLGVLVAVMGLAFLVTALGLRPAALDLVRGAVRPALPAGAGVLVLGLVGTTVVPYNLFLGSGLARGQSLTEVRFGLSVAILAGGAISGAVLVTGTAIPGGFDFASLAAVLEERLGGVGRTMFAVGLGAAGLSSAVTAPLAAAITARGLSGRPELWGWRSGRFRAVWLGVLGVGLTFGLLDVRPVPVILLAQALNGVLLPLVAVFLLRVVNDRALMGEEGRNGPAANVVTLLVLGVALLLGTTGLLRAAGLALGVEVADAAVLRAAMALAASGVLAAAGWILLSDRRRVQ